MGSHALLSASGSNKWIACPPSAKLEEKIEDKETIYAKEGKLAHKLAEINLLYKLENIEEKEYMEKLEEIKKDVLFNEDMIEHVNKYVSYVLKQIEKAKLENKYVTTLIERKLDISTWVKDSFGTADVVILCEDSIEVIDLKYGKGVLVEAKNNTQLMLYGLGALSDFDFIYQIGKVKMTIVQPRLNNIKEFEETTKSIYEFGEKVKPIAELAYKGEGVLKAGDHCRFCKVRCNCKELTKKAIEIETYKEKDLNELNHKELEEILDKIPILKIWIKAVEEYILDLTIVKGIKFKGKKLVEGRGQRKYVDEDKIKEVLLQKGYKEEEITKKELISVTYLEKLLGKQNFKNIVGKYVIKERGKLQLAEESDKREEYSSAKEDFNDGFELKYLDIV